jgi:hypothetical protein
MRPAAQLPGVLLIAAALLAGCGGDSGSTTIETTDPVVTSLEVGDLDCSEGSIGTIFVSWETANATAVDLVVDSGDPAGAGPSGAVTLTAPCDGSEHEVSVTPLGDGGPGEPETRTVGS